MIVKDKKFSKAVLSRDSYCPFCRRKATEAHHIVFKQMGGGGGDDIIENGIGLCYSCHFKIHNCSLKIPLSFLNVEQIKYILKKKYRGWRKIDWEN